MRFHTSSGNYSLNIDDWCNFYWGLYCMYVQSWEWGMIEQGRSVKLAGLDVYCTCWGIPRVCGIIEHAHFYEGV